MKTRERFLIKWDHASFFFNPICMGYFGAFETALTGCASRVIIIITTILILIGLCRNEWNDIPSPRGSIPFQAVAWTPG